MRRAQPLNPAAFLVYQDDGIVTPHRRAQLRRQSPNLVRCIDIAGKQNETERVGIAEECTLVS
jgi:hypothetical protein